MIVHLDLSQNCTGEEVSLGKVLDNWSIVLSFLVFSFFEDDRLKII